MYQMLPIAGLAPVLEPWRFIWVSADGYEAGYMTRFC
jgi:hypothetical protein